MVSFNELVSRSDIKKSFTNTGFSSDIFGAKKAMADVFLMILSICQVRASKDQQSVVAMAFWKSFSFHWVKLTSSSEWISPMYCKNFFIDNNRWPVFKTNGRRFANGLKKKWKKKAAPMVKCWFCHLRLLQSDLGFVPLAKNAEGRTEHQPS